MDRPGFDMAQFICSPPLRSETDQEALWERAGSDGRSTSSRPTTRRTAFAIPERQDWPTARSAPFTKHPERHARPRIAAAAAVLRRRGEGRLTLAQFVALTSTNPARLYGTLPAQGRDCRSASDADLADVGPRPRGGGERSAALHDAMDYTPFEGMRVTGWPSHTIARGELVWDGRSVHGDAGRGRFVARLPLEH